MSLLTAFTMADVITNIGSWVTGSVTWMQSVLTAITSEPLLLVPFFAGFLGVGFSLVRRALHAFR